MKISLSMIVLPMLMLLSVAVQADTVYRCQTEAHTPVYSDHVCGPNAHRVHVPPPAATAVAPPTTVPPPAGDHAPASPPVNINNQNSVNVAPSESPARAQDRGLPFSQFRLLDTGMSEGQVLSITGPPDRETVDAVNTRDGIQHKSYYYFSHGYNASVTRIQFVNGRVRSLNRTPILSR